MELGETYDIALRKLLNLPYEKKQIHFKTKNIVVSKEVFDMLQKIKGKRTYSEVIKILKDIKEQNFDDDLFDLFLKYSLSEEEKEIYEQLRLYAQRR